jgi:hypothetical protein
LRLSALKEVPHGVGSFVSVNRLNVAISRAWGLAILLSSRALLMFRTRTIEHVRPAGAMHRLVELAGIRAVEWQLP